MTSEQRFPDFEHFWPFYVGEHRHPACRVLHFIGTSGFVTVFIACCWMNPVRMGACALAGVIVGFLARKIEARRKAGRELLSMAVLWLLGSPWLLVGIFWAYLCAWIGHFKIEHNRPATFTYPLWSLFGDFRMVGVMLTGRLWSGDGSDIAPLGNIAG